MKTWYCVFVVAAFVAVFGILAFTACDDSENINPLIPPPFQGPTTITEIETYLDEQTGGNSTDEPVSLAIKIDLRNMTEVDSNWQKLLNALETSGKFIDLDLSACTGVTEFNPYSAIPIGGEDKIVSITLPKTATIIAAGPNWMNPTFGNFTSLESVSGMSITSIGFGAFYSCTSLITVNLPSLKSIGLRAFSDCERLTTINLQSLNSIGTYAFAGCTSLLQVTLPANLSSIGTSPFSECTSLVLFTLTGTGSLSTFDSGKALVWDNNRLVSYPSATGNITLPATIISIDGNAFTHTGLSGIIFSQSLSSIGMQAFQYCTNLTEITLPSTLTFIGQGSFYGCTNLALVTCLANEPPTLEFGSAFLDLEYSSLTAIKVPADSVQAYKEAEDWDRYKDLIIAIGG